MNNRLKKKNSRPKQTTSKETRNDLRLVRELGAQTRTVLRRICGPPSTMSTNAGGLLVASTLCISNGVNSAADFAALAGLFTSYRVRSMRVQIRPFYPVPFFNGVGTVTVPASIAAGFMQGGVAGATYQALSDSAKPRFLSGYKQHDLTINWEGDTDAHLWTATTTGISSSEAFGIVVCGQGTASTVNTYVWHYSVEYVVEFKAPF